jgi:hypothetical protein
MTDIHQCEYNGCEVTFDVDDGKGIIITKIDGEGNMTKHYYCCIAHNGG